MQADPASDAAVRRLSLIPCKYKSADEILLHLQNLGFLNDILVCRQPSCFHYMKHYSFRIGLYGCNFHMVFRSAWVLYTHKRD